eukprot:146334-Chlamydomonas_euryale.AAC.7
MPRFRTDACFAAHVVRVAAHRSLPCRLFPVGASQQSTPPLPPVDCGHVLPHAHTRTQTRMRTYARTHAHQHARRLLIPHHHAVLTSYSGASADSGPQSFP